MTRYEEIKAAAAAAAAGKGWSRLEEIKAAVASRDCAISWLIGEVERLTRLERERGGRIPRERTA